jgi:hypothetical protein
MKFIYSFLFSFLFFSISFSQEKFDYNNIQKIELHSFSKNYYCKDIKSSNLSSKTVINCNTEKIKPFLMDLEKPKYDVLTEKQCVLIRVYFKDKQCDYVVFPDQGLLMNLNSPYTFFSIKNRDGFKKLILSYINK